MAHIIPITDANDPRLDVFARLTEAQLRNKLEPEKGVFIAESPKVIALALDAGYTPLALLMEERQLEGPARDLLPRCEPAPVYTGARDVLASLTGYAPHPGGVMRLSPAGPAYGGGRMRRRPAGGGAGRHRRHHQRGGHLPLGSRPPCGWGPPLPHLL